MNKHANDITVRATVVDADTIRYGGSAFRRERACHKVPMLCARRQGYATVKRIVGDA